MIARLVSLVLWLLAAWLIVFAVSETHRGIAVIAWAVAVLLTTLAVAAWQEGE